MQCAVELMGREQFPQGAAIQQISAMEFCLWVDGRAKATAQIIKYHHLFTSRDQSVDHMTADVARPSRYEIFHSNAFPK